MPINYFAFLWGIDQLDSLSHSTMRLPNLFALIIAFTLMFKVLLKTFGKVAAIISIITVVTHSLSIPFILTEARPYAVYFMFASWLLFAFERASSINCGYKIDWNLFFVNFLCPAFFYIGGAYCLISLLAYLLHALIYKKPITSVLLSCVLGWSTFAVILLPSFFEQMKSTFGSISNTNHNFHDLFSLYGTLVYYPISLILLICFVTLIPSFRLKQNTSSISTTPSPRLSLVLLLSAVWLLLPLLFFIFGEFLNISFLQERYFIPNIISSSIVIAFIIFLLQQLFIPTKNALLLYFTVCTSFMGINCFLLGKAYEIDSPGNHLKFIQEEHMPILTFSMRIAFHIGYYQKENTFLIVGDHKYADYMNKFSKKSNPVALSSLNLLVQDFKKHDGFIFIKGPMGYPKSFDIYELAEKNDYLVTKSIEINSPEITAVCYLEPKSR